MQVAMTVKKIYEGPIEAHLLSALLWTTDCFQFVYVFLKTKRHLLLVVKNEACTEIWELG